jgi:heptosyltransferase-2
MSAAPLSPAARVFVRLPRWLGDFVASEPLVRALDAHLVRGTLTLAGAGAHLALFEGRFPRVRRLPLDGARERVADWRGHELALLCTGSLRHAALAFLAGIPRRAGFARGGRGPLLTDAFVPGRERGGVPLGLGRAGRGARILPRPLERSLGELAAVLGVASRDLRPRLEVQASWRVAARARRAALGLALEAPFVLANVGARAESAKAYPSAHWAAVLAPLARESALPVLLACGPGEEPALAAVQAALPAAKALVAPPAALPELAAHCAEARLVLGTDSGPRHVARALGAPLVCVAGPTDPRHTAGERARETLLRVEVPCGPCHRERCPLRADEHHRCMRALEPERVLAVARAALAAVPEPSGTIPG